MNKVVARFKADVEIELDRLVKDLYSTIDMREITSELEKRFWNAVHLSDIKGISLQNLDFRGLEVKNYESDDK